MKYTVRYREIKTFMYDSDPGWLELPRVTNNFGVISLDWDKDYEIAVKSVYVIKSTEHGSDWSISWNVKTHPGMTLRDSSMSRNIPSVKSVKYMGLHTHTKLLWVLVAFVQCVPPQLLT